MLEKQQKENAFASERRTWADKEAAMAKEKAQREQRIGELTAQLTAKNSEIESLKKAVDEANAKAADASNNSKLIIEYTLKLAAAEVAMQEKDEAESKLAEANKRIDALRAEAEALRREAAEQRMRADALESQNRLIKEKVSKFAATVKANRTQQQQQQQQQQDDWVGRYH